MKNNRKQIIRNKTKQNKTKQNKTKQNNTKKDEDNTQKITNALSQFKHGHSHVLRQSIFPFELSKQCCRFINVF